MSTAPSVGVFLCTFLFSLGYLVARRDPLAAPLRAGRCVFVAAARADGRSESCSGGHTCRGGSCSSTSSSRSRGLGRRDGRACDPVRAPERRLRRSLRNSASRPARAARARSVAPSAAGTTVARAPRSPAATSRRPGRPSDSPRSSRKASSTSRRHGRTCRSSTVGHAGSTGPRTRSTTRRSRGSTRDACSCSGSSRTSGGERSRMIVDLARGSRRRADGHARLVARRRAAYASVARDRRRDRRGADRAARPAAVALRGADRDRRRAPRRVQHGATFRRSASGPRCRTTCRSRPARARRSRSASGSATSSARRSTRPSSTRRRERYSEQVSEAVASDEETAAYVEELEQRAEMLDDEQDDSLRRVARRRADALPA